MKKILTTLILLNSLLASAEVLKIQNGQVKFVAVGKPGFLKIHGESKSEGANGAINIDKGQATGSFTFKLASLDTGIDMRNEHMKEKYLEIKKHPDVTLTINPIAITSAELTSTTKKPFTGKLSLHGETKDITGEFELKEGKNLQAKFAISSLSDYKIDIPKYMGVTVSEKVEVEVNSTLIK